ncbi:hypothetical protein TNCV_2739971 [Trichonephila clavipes]|nr:hypothetical protein TNCV_2739971 [Trichonephila clavipes]
MVVLRILEASLYLFFSAIADYIQVDLVSFLEIFGCVLVFDLIKNLTGIYFESTTQVQEVNVIAKRYNKFEGIAVNVVHPLMIFKMCEGLGLQAQLAPELDRKIWLSSPHSKSAFQNDSDVF